MHATNRIAPLQCRTAKSLTSRHVHQLRAIQPLVPFVFEVITPSDHPINHPHVIIQRPGWQL